MRKKPPPVTQNRVRDAEIAIEGLVWMDKASAYQTWLAQGNVGTPADFLNSLIGQAGADGISITAVNTPSRTFNANFTPHATRPVLCMYSVQIEAAAIVGTDQAGTVELRSDTNATPTTVRASVMNDMSITLGIGIGVTNKERSILMYLVPANHNVRLVTSGSAAMSLVHQTEVVL